jgi:hypothetical protein
VIEVVADHRPPILEGVDRVGADAAVGDPPIPDATVAEIVELRSGKCPFTGKVTGPNVAPDAAVTNGSVTNGSVADGSIPSDASVTNSSISEGSPIPHHAAVTEPAVTHPTVGDSSVGEAAVAEATVAHPAPVETTGAATAVESAAHPSTIEALRTAAATVATEVSTATAPSHPGAAPPHVPATAAMAEDRCWGKGARNKDSDDDNPSHSGLEGAATADPPRRPEGTIHGRVLGVD